MSDYYDIDKPYSITNWNKLIRVINNRLDIPPTGCQGIEPLEEAEPGHIWTKEDVENVREVLRHMCIDNEFEEDLDGPWRTSIIDELEEQIRWCDCGFSPLLLAYHLPELGFCRGDPTPSTSLSSLIDGMQVSPGGFTGDCWRVIQNYQADWTFHRERASTVAEGEVTCDGTVDYTGGYTIPDGFYYNYYCNMDGEEFPQRAEARVAEGLAEGDFQSWTFYYLRCGIPPRARCPE
jgi:hypothetical protein